MKGKLYVVKLDLVLCVNVDFLMVSCYCFSLNTLSASCDITRTSVFRWLSQVPVFTVMEDLDIEVKSCGAGAWHGCQ